MLPDRDIEIERKFPDIFRLSYQITSPVNPYYNCIAWAANDETKWWWPDSSFQAYWPASVPRVCTMEAFILAYQTIGYEQCENIDPEVSFEKIAIFADSNGVPTHAARGLINQRGVWTSKLGKYYDISHHVYGLNGQEYGSPIVFMKRRINNV